MGGDDCSRFFLRVVKAVRAVGAPFCAAQRLDLGEKNPGKGHICGRSGA